MKIIPYRQSLWDPFTPLEDIQREMNNMFDRSLSRLPKEETWAPAVDIVDDKDMIRVKAELPGVPKDQVDVNIQDGILSIKGEKKQEKEVKDKDCIRTERFFGSFRRSFSLPSGVDAQGIKANYKDGVLEVILPKKEDAKSKSLKVKIE